MNRMLLGQDTLYPQVQASVPGPRITWPAAQRTGWAKHVGPAEFPQREGDRRSAGGGGHLVVIRKTDTKNLRRGWRLSCQ